MNLLFASYNLSLFNKETLLRKTRFKSILFDISSVFGSVMHYKHLKQRQAARTIWSFQILEALKSSGPADHAIVKPTIMASL